MNSVDVAVAAVVGVAGLRGYWRGFFRELFGILALVGGIAAAIAWTPTGAGLLEGLIPGPQMVRDGVVFVGLFAIAHLAINLAGLALNRLASALLLGGVNRAAGALFGGAKAAALAAVVLLFLHLFPISPALDERVMQSSIGRPLVLAAQTLLQIGVRERAKRSR